MPVELDLVVYIVPVLQFAIATLEVIVPSADVAMITVSVFLGIVTQVLTSVNMNLK